MNLKKILAAVAATAVAVSTMAVSAFAEEVAGPSKDIATDVNADVDGGTLAIAGEDIPEGCTEIKVDITIPEGGWGGGCIGYNDTTATWTSINWDASISETVAISDIAEGEGLQVQVWWLGGCDAIIVETTFVISEDETTDDETTDDETTDDETTDDETTDDETTEVTGTGVSYGTPYVTEVEEGATSATIKLSPITTNENANWNDWCALKIAVTDADGNVEYYAVIGAQVSWDITVDDNGTADDDSDDIKIVSADCVVMTEDGATVEVAVSTGSTIEVIALGWDSNPDEAYFAVDSVEYTFDDTDADTEDETTDDETDSETDADDTSDTGLAVAFGGVALAAAAVVATKKRK